jgi:prolyl-tRNA synthetase
MPVASHSDGNVIPAVQALAAELNASGLRATVDSRDVRPGVKHYDWEIKGVPIRVELGPRDLKSSKCVATLRTGGKIEIDLDEAPAKIRDMLLEISDELRNRANSLVSDIVQEFPIENLDSKDNLDSIIDDGIVYEIAFDGNDSDAEFLERKTGLTLLGECDDPFAEPRKCLVTHNPTTKKQYIARMY